MRELEFILVNRQGSNAEFTPSGQGGKSAHEAADGFKCLEVFEK